MKRFDFRSAFIGYENKYHALWTGCTHQGTELQVFGDRLQCPAHGSEFANTGAVLKRLGTFTHLSNNHL